MTHIMLDLETWGRTPGSDIRSIGAVVFDPTAPYGGFVGMECPSCKNGAVEPWGCTDCLNTGKDMRGEFYIATDNPIEHGRPWTPPQGGSEIKPWSYRYKLTRDPDTVDWWSKQSEEAQKAFANPVDLKQALQRFTDWLASVHMDMDIQGATRIDETCRIWCNGPHFDEAILAAVFRAVELPVPWHYRSPRDFRTITEAAGMTSADYINYGEAHNALDDAIAQAMTVCEAYKRLGLQQ